MRRNTTRTGLLRRQKNFRYQIREWGNRMLGIPAFIVGNGPSLNAVDWSLLEDFFVVGINRVFPPYVPLDPTILFWQDVSLWTSEYHRIHNLRALKICRDLADPRRVFFSFTIKSGGYFFGDSPAVLHGRGNTAAICAQFCVALGCSPLILLGCDCKLGQDGQTDFYGENEYWIDKSRTLSNCVRGLQFIKDHSPVEVISCSENDLWASQRLEVVVDRFVAYRRERQSYVTQLTMPREKV